MTLNTPSPKAALLLQQQAQIETQLNACQLIIGKARRGAMGLTLDEDKTAEWHEAKRKYAILWDAYRKVNAALTKLRKVVGYEAVDGKRVCIYQYK